MKSIQLFIHNRLAKRDLSMNELYNKMPAPLVNALKYVDHVACKTNNNELTFDYQFIFNCLTDTENEIKKKFTLPASI
mgnify:CR=1 FL=1